MKAMVNAEYGPPDVFQLKEVDKPTPRENEVLIQVRATAVTFGEITARDATFSPGEFWLPGLLWPLARMQLGFSKPSHTILGSEFAGEVEAVGEKVQSFKPGDQVFGFSERFGANAEYLCLPEDGVLAPKPASLSFEEAAVVPHGALTALHFIRDKAEIESGQRVLIVGASGGIGQYAVQLARAFGAEVTGVCSSSKLDLVRSLGAGKVIDYTQEDLTESGEAYDVIFDTKGVTSFSDVKGSLNEGGRYLKAAFSTGELFQMLGTAVMGGKKVVCSLAPIKKEGLNDITALVKAGKLRPVIDKVYPLEQVAEAHRYFESGQRKGYIVVAQEPGTEV